LATAAGVAGAHFGWLAPYAGFRVFLSGVVVAGLVTPVLGALDLRVAHRGSGRGRTQGLIGLAIGLATLWALFSAVWSHRGAPAIHDVTTDLGDPPFFREAAKVPENAGRDLAYPNGGANSAELQRAAYPDLQPIVLETTPAEAFDRALEIAGELGWKLTWANAELGVLEATDTSGLFRFVDDVVVRIRSTDQGTVLDLRSTSRVGRGDLGANAARIRRFRDRLAQ